MKNIRTKIINTLLFCFAILACKQESVMPVLQPGANSRVILSYPDNSYLNFQDLAGASLAFDVYSINTNIDKIEYTVAYKSFATGLTTAPVLAITLPASGFTNGKATKLQLTAAELTTLLALPGGIANLQGGDSFIFTQKMFLTDGTTFDLTNSAPSILAGGNASFTPQFTVYVGCPSDQTKIAGTYTATVDANNAGEPTGVPHEVFITFKGPEPFRYSVTDHTGSLYVPYGGKEYPADFYDICGTPILLPSASFGPVVNFIPAAEDIPPFSASIIDTSGPATVIIFSWHETGNDIVATMRFVKKP